MNLFQIGLLFSLPVHTYLLTRETGYCTFQHLCLRTKADFFGVEFYV